MSEPPSIPRVRRIIYLTRYDLLLGNWENPEVRETKAGIKHRLQQTRYTKSDKDWSELLSHQASYLTSHTPGCWRNATGIFLPKPGKGDYYNPKSYRTISLSPVPLRWMERLVLSHMEEDLKIYSKLKETQYCFAKGFSTETALHKLVHKIKRAILNSGMALGTFLDIEGAFKNVAFHAIEKAPNKKCSLPNTNNWIKSMIK